MAGLVRWDPFRRLERLREEIEHGFGPHWGLSAWPFREARNWFPVDLYETTDEYQIVAELPGVAREEIDLHVEQNSIALSVEKKAPELPEGAVRHCCERPYGHLTRTFTLPADVNLEQVKATYENGVLRVTVPKAEASKPRKVQIS